MKTELEFLVSCVENLLETYEFKLSAVLDANKRCIPYQNAVQLRQLERALWAVREKNEGASQ